MRSESFRNVLAFFLALALIISIAPESFAASKKKSDEAKEHYNKAVKYEYSWDSRNYEKAFDCYCKAADLGNTDAMAELGWLYAPEEDIIMPHYDLAGELGIQQDVDHAYELFKEAADSNNPSAIAGLGYLEYESDLNSEIEPDENSECVKLFEKAASLGDPRAMMYLGDIAEDNAVAVDYYTKAAEKNDPFVLYHIAACYYDSGVYDPENEKDRLHFNQLSFYYFLRSSELGFDMTDMAYILITEFGDAKTIKKISKDKTVDYKKAFKIASSLASYNDPGAMDILGFMYEHGLGVKKNGKTAQKWYDKAEAAYEAQWSDGDEEYE